MLIEGAEVVTKSTQTAARRLTIIGATIVAISWFRIPLKDLEILGVKGFPPELFSVIGLSLLLFSFVSLILNWTADRKAFLDWYSSSHVPIATWGGGIPSLSNSEYLSVQLKRISDGLEGDKERAGFQADTIQEAITKLEDHLAKCGHDHKTLGAFGWFLLYVWYFAVPILVGGLALLAICRPAVEFGAGVVQ